MEQLEVPFGSLTTSQMLSDMSAGVSIIPQFSSLSGPLDMATVTGNMTGNGAVYTNTSSMVSNTTNNSEDHRTVYNVENLTIDLNSLSGDEKQQWYDMLNSLYPGGA